MFFRAALLAALVVIPGRSARAQGAPLPSSTLAIANARGVWRDFWSSAHAPTVWKATPVANAIAWRPGAAGTQQVAELLACEILPAGFVRVSAP